LNAAASANSRLPMTMMQPNYAAPPSPMMIPFSSGMMHHQHPFMTTTNTWRNHQQQPYMAVSFGGSQLPSPCQMDATTHPVMTATPLSTSLSSPFQPTSSSSMEPTLSRRKRSASSSEDEQISNRESSGTPSPTNLSSFPTKRIQKLKEASPKTIKRRNLTDEASEEEDSSTQNSCGLGGEHRLSIQFHNMGKLGEEPQTFGKSGYIIPDGLCGSHRMYSQDWKFEIIHKNPRPLLGSDQSLASNRGIVVLTWSITNLTSHGVVSITESPQQALMRQTKGNTICNTVLRKALEQRIEELQVELSKKDKTPLQIANLRSLIKELCPKKCAQGLLFFGLRHEIVQRVKTADANSPPAAAASSSIENHSDASIVVTVSS